MTARDRHGNRVTRVAPPPVDTRAQAALDSVTELVAAAAALAPGLRRLEAALEGLRAVDPGPRPGDPDAPPEDWIDGGPPVLMI